MIMKKQIFSLGLMLAAAFTLTNCAKENVQSPELPSEGIPFEITAVAADTKTVNGGMTTSWAAGDEINVFHAVGKTTDYKNDNAFTVSDVEAGKFNGTLAAELDPQEEYDWFAFYPYSSYIKTPANTSSGYMPIGSKSNETQEQTGNNSMAHIAGPNYPIAGRAIAVPASSTPEIEMSHLSSLLEINVTNATDEPLTVSNIIFTAPDDIVGTFYINFSGEISPESFKGSGSTYVSKSATLKVANGEAIESTKSAKFYLAVKPFVALADQELSIVVNGYERKIKLTKDVEFSAGKIKTLNFSYENSAKADALTLPWYEDFTSKDLSSYILVNGGTDTKLYDTDNLAGGAAPELLVSKSNGMFTAKISTEGYIGALTLTFKCNYPDRLNVSTSTSGVELVKVSNLEYTLNITESVDEFDITFMNSTSSNARLDNISLVKGVLLTQTLTFATPSYSLTLGSAEAENFVGQQVQGAKTTVVYSSSDETVATVDAQTGMVTLKNVEGSAKITAFAQANEEYKEASAEYLISVSKPNVGGVKQYSFSITKDDFTSKSYADNNKEHTSTAKALDGTTIQVKWTSNQVMNQSSTMQWQKNTGYIYNSTDLGQIDNVTVTSTAGSFTKYIGSSVKPTSSGNGGFFQIKVGSATGKVTEIVVTFTK